MKQKPYTLRRERDGQEWHTVALTPEQAVHQLSGEMGEELYISEDIGEFGLTWNEYGPEGLISLGVMPGKPKYYAVLSQVVDGFTVTFGEREPVKILADKPVGSEDEALALLEGLLRQHNVASQDCGVKRVYR